MAAAATVGLLLGSVWLLWDLISNKRQVRHVQPCQKVILAVLGVRFSLLGIFGYVSNVDSHFVVFVVIAASVCECACVIVCVCVGQVDFSLRTETQKNDTRKKKELFFIFRCSFALRFSLSLLPYFFFCKVAKS